MKNISEVLHLASETHHTVYKKVEGEDGDWAIWYANWIIELSDLPELLDKKFVKSELIYYLVKLDKDYNHEKPQEKWEDYYAERLQKYFSN